MDQVRICLNCLKTLQFEDLGRKRPIGIIDSCELCDEKTGKLYSISVKECVVYVLKTMIKYVKK